MSRTPLHYAALKDAEESAQALIDAGADVDAADQAGTRRCTSQPKRAHSSLAGYFSRPEPRSTRRTRVAILRYGEPSSTVGETAR
jgi:ankyrin repeat protein